MDKLIEQMKVILGSSFALYLKVQGFHWNVKSADFYQYHSFLEKIYTDVYGGIDAIAEEIRSLDAYAPASLGRFKQLSVIQDEDRVLQPGEMFSIILSDNTLLLSEIKKGYELAEQADEIGLSNFLQDRYDAHKKLSWMVKSTLTGAR